MNTKNLAVSHISAEASKGVTKRAAIMDAILLAASNQMTVKLGFNSEIFVIDPIAICDLVEEQNMRPTVKTS